MSARSVDDGAGEAYFHTKAEIESPQTRAPKLSSRRSSDINGQAFVPIRADIDELTSRIQQLEGELDEQKTTTNCLVLAAENQKRSPRSRSPPWRSERQDMLRMVQVALRTNGVPEAELTHGDLPSLLGRLCMEHYRKHLELQEMYATQQRMLEGNHSVEIADLQQELQRTQEIVSKQKEELVAQRDELGAQLGILEWRLKEANTRNTQLEAALRHCRGTDGGGGAGTGSGGGATPRRPPSPLPSGSGGEQGAHAELNTPGGLSALSCTLSLSTSPYGEVWPFKSDVVYEATAFLRSLLENEDAGGQQLSEGSSGEHGASHKRRAAHEMLAKLPVSQRLDLLELAGIARRLEPALLAQGAETLPETTGERSGESYEVLATSLPQGMRKGSRDMFLMQSDTVPGLLNLDELSHPESHGSNESNSMDRARMITPEERGSLIGESVLVSANGRQSEPFRRPSLTGKSVLVYGA